ALLTIDSQDGKRSAWSIGGHKPRKEKYPRIVRWEIDEPTKIRDGPTLLWYGQGQHSAAADESNRACWLNRTTIAANSHHLPCVIGQVDVDIAALGSAANRNRPIWTVEKASAF